MKRIKRTIKKIKEYFIKKSRNCRWELRYRNIEKKYGLALVEIEELKEKINNDENLLIIADKDRSILRYKRIIETLRKDNKELRERK
jgi:hypothetical protein